MKPKLKCKFVIASRHDLMFCIDDFDKVRLVTMWPRDRAKFIKMLEKLIRCRFSNPLNLRCDVNVLETTMHTIS